MSWALLFADEAAETKSSKGEDRLGQSPRGGSQGKVCERASGWLLFCWGSMTHGFISGGNCSFKRGGGASGTGGRKTGHSSLVLCVLGEWYQRPFPEKHKKPEMDWQKNVTDLGQGFSGGLKSTSRQWGNTGVLTLCDPPWKPLSVHQCKKDRAEINLELTRGGRWNKRKAREGYWRTRGYCLPEPHS